MKLYLIRHGDPDYANDTITELGRKQVAALRREFVDLPLNRICCSPLGRAQATCEPVAKAKHMTFETKPYLHELDGVFRKGVCAWDLFAYDLPETGWTDWENAPYAAHMKKASEELFAGFDELMAEYGLRRRASGLYDVAPDGKQAESLALFCHAGVILTLLAWILHLPPALVYSQFGCEPTSVTLLELETHDGIGGFRLVHLNDMCHWQKTL